MAHGAPALLFDLDGTLVDSVYQHVLAWHEVLGNAGMELSVWRIHRKIGMSGGLFANALLRETGLAVTQDDAMRLRKLHGDAYARRSGDVRPLPGARELLAYLTTIHVPWAIATSGHIETAGKDADGPAARAAIGDPGRDRSAHARGGGDLDVSVNGGRLEHPPAAGAGRSLRDGTSGSGSPDGRLRGR